MTGQDFLLAATANALGTILGGVVLAAITGLFAGYVRLINKAQPESVQARSKHLAGVTTFVAIFQVVEIGVSVGVGLYEGHAGRKAPGWALAFLPPPPPLLFATLVLPACAWGLHALAVWVASWKRWLDGP